MLSENPIADSNHKKPDYVTAPEIVPQGKKNRMRDSTFVFSYCFVCRSSCGRLCLG